MAFKHIFEYEQKLLFAKLLKIAQLALNGLWLYNVVSAGKSSGLIDFAPFC